MLSDHDRVRLDRLVNREPFERDPPFALPTLARAILDLDKRVRAIDDPTYTPSRDDYVVFGEADAAVTTLDLVEADMIAPATFSGVLVGEPQGEGPIDSAELQRRGITPELEGRAIEVVLRMGWPRRDDPLGINPCVPVPVPLLEQIHRLATQDLSRTIEPMLAALLSDQVQRVETYGASIAHPEPEGTAH